LCFYERHGRGRTYTRFGPLLPMRLLYHCLGQSSSHGEQSLISPPSFLHSSV
jgi:hypothetical protein